MKGEIHGGCLCGAIRFALSQAPLEAGYCHCTRCQRRTGTAASPSARISPGSLEIVQGEELLRWWRAQQGGYEKGFCERCGSHLFSRNPDNPEQIGIRLGAFDSDPGVKPGWHQFVAYAAAWESIPDDGLPRFPERKP